MGGSGGVWNLEDGEVGVGSLFLFRFGENVFGNVVRIEELGF